MVWINLIFALVFSVVVYFLYDEQELIVEVKPTVNDFEAVEAASQRSTLSDFELLQDRQASATFEALLLNAEFELLESLGNQVISTRAVSSDGQPLLNALYEASGCAGRPCSQQSEDDWVLKKTLIQQWQKAYPNSVLATLSESERLIGKAWSIRGHGFARDVNNSAWSGFKDGIEEAYQYLRQNFYLSHTSVHWHSQILDIGIAQSWGDGRMRAAFDKGRKLDKRYLPLYFTYAASIGERWGGNNKLVNFFIREMVELDKDDPDWGMEIYTRVHWSERSNEMFQNGNADWRSMDKGFNVLLDKYDDDWTLQNYAYFACTASDGRPFIKYEQRLRDSFSPKAWYGSTEYFENCIKWAKETAHLWRVPLHG
jgi:hypothetical protein